VVVNGAISITEPIPAMSTWMLMLLAAAMAFIALKIRM